MKKHACTLLLMAWPISALALMIAVYPKFRRIDQIFWPSVAAAIVVVIGLAFLLGIRNRLAERAMVRRGTEGEGLIDGARCAAVGRLTGLGERLVAPFTHKNCVGYEYEIYTHTRHRKNKSKISMFQGFRLAPTAVQTRSRSIKLLAFPDFAFAWDYPEGEAALRNARAYIAATQFEQVHIGNVRERIDARLKLVADDDGVMRFDNQHHSWPAELIPTLAERLLIPGEEVCAIGTYSAGRGGLVPPPPGTPVHPIRILKGSPERVMRSLSLAAFGYFVGALLCLGGVVAGVWLIYHYR